ncbi:response regulator transcription factor [Gordonibacter massiliensis (ex Traore et al. 2017)]|uniref:response regulator transcription factor n=1 Tax=Gordonibacter massiliensis (ex Traore et al. 2017) TaxID=1841863 RepID=UPI001C8BB49C|nr:helix-turn-helix transcriptional regulator [Gordonibacter massiliensis (ex Traore et al. 2017)]MBX9035412.1 helix-turn-helix transcriptional regulator [Gordonibacter massiliensis (ex Traore et al. 2017)]
MAEITKNGSPRKESSYSERELAGIAGFTLFSASVLLAAFSPLLATPGTNTPVMHGLTHGTMFASMAGFYFAITRFIKRRNEFVSSRRAQAVFLVLQLLLPAAVLLETALELVFPLALQFTLWAIQGAASAYFSCTWADLRSSLGEERIRSANLWSFGLAGCIVTGVLAMPPFVDLTVFLLLCACSFALLVASPPSGTEATSERDERWLAETSRYSANGSYIMTVDGMMCGVIAGLVVARISKGVLPPTIMGLAFVCVALIFFVLHKKAPGLLAMGRVQLVLLPFLICGLIISGFLQAPWNTVAALPLFVILYLLDYTNASVLSLRGTLLSISPCYCFARGRIFIVLGQALGWFAGAFVATEFGKGWLTVAAMILIVLVCIYIPVATVNPDKYPIIADAPDPAKDQAPPEGAQGPTPELVIEQHYKHKCAEATRTYNLTPREGEILFFLVKGRNARHIADQLYVAERTIKTHTYHIYQKMGIHSQQELIDIVEQQEANDDTAESCPPIL